MAEERWRLFIGILVPHDAADLVTDACADLRQRYPAARWTPAASLHLTLVFLGATSPDAVAAIREAMVGAAERAEPLPVELTRGGGTRHGVGWLESGEAESAPLAQLVLDLRAVLGLASDHPEHPFLAHATVCRGASSALIKELRAVRVTPPIAWRAGSIVLFRSRTGPGGPRYEVLATAEMALAPSAIR